MLIRISRIAALLLAFALAGCTNDPYPDADKGRKVLYTSFSEVPKTLDPAVSYTTSEHVITGNVYDTLLEYHYLERPYKLIPGLAEAVPEPEALPDGGQRYRFRIRPGVLFHDDICFGGRAPGQRSREVTAQDFAFQFARLADPAINSPVASSFVQVKGFQAFAKRLADLRKADAAFARQALHVQYAKAGGIEGVVAASDRDLEIVLSEANAQILYWFAMPFTTPIAWEAVAYYDGREGRPNFADHVVGTGPFRLAVYDKQLRYVLEKNPTWYGLRPDAAAAPGVTFPATIDPADVAAKRIDPAYAGRRMPFLDRVNFARERENIPRFNKFLQGYYDDGGIIKESFDAIVQGDRLSPDMAKRGMRLDREVEPSIFYIGDGFERVLRSHREIIGTRASHTVDIKFRRGDGVVIDCAVTSKVVYAEDGRIVGFSGTIQDITERKLAEKQLEALAYYDPLTGLANRALFTRQLEDVLSDAGRSAHTSALLLLDLDRFKEVNDSLGHSSGDELLVKVGNAVSRLLDSQHFLARLGGDEFAVIVRGATDCAAIEDLARRIIAAISGAMHLEHGEVAISTSIGIALIEPGKTATELLRNADLALYTAKADGRARFAMFRPEMDEVVQSKMVMARELRRALIDGAGLSVHYQPQVDLRTGRVVSYEALMRWTHPVLGSVPPDEFIPIAESSHLIVDLGLWILREAALQIARWQDAGLPDRQVAVNISAAQIWHSDLVTDVAEILRATGIRPNLLCLELTESLLVDHAEARARTVLGKLSALGVSLALDDFGTDYSSLGYLTQLPFDKIKIDRIFITGIAQSARARELLKGIIALGHGLGMTVVPEGAEQPDQIDLLVGFGCDLVQGFGISRPVPADMASAFAEGFHMANADNAVHALHARIAAGF